ncbi:MAG TPA: glycosyltransferase [Candidatus Dormibacteraeota bacterium]|nr:glycosyltransferase [Candidatus Dormibacteraeota bacterium]
MITVIIPTRNCLKFLQPAVASVVAQSFSDWELIVVDDVSEDGTWDWLRGLEDRRIHSLRMDEHRERSAARNAGLREARGEFVLFLDNDDLLFPGALSRLLEALQSHPGAIAAVGARLDFNLGSQRRVRHPLRGYVRNTWLDAMLGWVPQCGQVLLRRTAVAQAGGWKDDYIPAEDHDLWVRLSPLGPVVLIPQIVLGYRIHPQQTSKVFVRSRTIALRRSCLSECSGEERVRGERTVLAWRHNWIAARAFRRRRFRDACRHCWLAVRQAPWLLESPLCRGEITDLGFKSLVGMAFGEPTIRGLRRCKRILASALPKGRLRRSLLRAEAGRPEAP